MPVFRRHRMWMSLAYGLLAVVAAGVLLVGTSNNDTAWSVAGFLGLLIVAATAPVAFLLANLSTRPLGSSAQGDDGVGRLLAQIHEHTMLSDNAKRVLFRDRELGLLRGAIEDDITRGDYNAAITLCDEMANLFGHREEAEAFRAQIAQVRQEHYEAQVQAAGEQFQTHLAERNWSAVHQEAARIRRLFPDTHLADDLDRRIAQARQEHKQELERQFLEASGRDDVEAAMALLKRLDLYLSHEEAGRLTEVAQGVIVRHRENLGAQFRLAVNEHRWDQAAGLGETIVAEFPNSKMATEVRSMIDQLRTRASRAAVTAQGSQ